MSEESQESRGPSESKQSGDGAHQRGDEPILSPSQLRSSTELAWVDGVTRILDSKLRVPGTDLRFGADFLLGLIPGAGDVISFCMSGLLIITMAKNGASASLVLKMLLNVSVDALVGSVPILGNLFDLYYKANTRNLELMREYYQEDKHRGSVWPVVLGVVAILFVVILVAVWLLVHVLRWIVAWF